MVFTPVATAEAPGIGPNAFGLYEGLVEGCGGGGTGEPDVLVVPPVPVAVAVGGGGGGRRHSGWEGPEVSGGPGGLEYISGNPPEMRDRYKRSKRTERRLEWGDRRKKEESTSPSGNH